jgi:hypothetical protein
MTHSALAYCERNSPEAAQTVRAALVENLHKARVTDPESEAWISGLLESLGG